MALIGALATVLLLPFLWVLWTRAEPEVSRLALLVGVVAAVAAIAASLWWAQPLGGDSTQHRLLQRIVDRVFRALGPGYWENGRTLPGHYRAIGFAALLLVAYLGFLAFSPSRTAVPPAALPFVLLFVALVCQYLAALAFFLDRWRVPVVVIALAAVLVMNDYRPKIHEFETQYLEHPISAPNLGTGRTLTVIAADGGGIQAAAWSTQVLTSLQSELGDEFTGSVRLISSVSGGSVGTYFYLAGAVHDGASGPLPESRDCVRRAAAESSLSATAWGLVGPDFLRATVPVGVPPTLDRGWALERAWMNSAERMRRAIGGDSETGSAVDCTTRFERHRDALASADGALRLSELRRMADAGELPYLVFNSTFVDTGEQAFFTTTDPGLLGCRQGEACWDFRNLEMRVATAARLSATFPYVTPISRPSVEEFRNEVPNFPQWSVADGGYFDNFGSFAAIRWLQNLRPQLARAGVTRVVLVQILTFPKTSQAPPVDSQGLLYSTAGPLKAILAVRTSSQLDRTREELQFLEESFRWGEAADEAPELHIVELRPHFIPNQDAPLSWHLSRQNIETIREQWREMCSSNSELERLRTIFGASKTCV